MDQFITDNFLLENSFAVKLYYDYAAKMPIIDYHNHLSPQMIAADYKFDNITAAWLNGDHYKWRAMRTNGINEQFCTGNASDWEKFQQWAETVPYTMMNPLFHWTQLELKRYFNIDELLQPNSAKRIYDQCNDQLSENTFSVKNILLKMNVQFIGTTDDPLDDLSFHQQIDQQAFDIKVKPSFRPDKAIHINNAVTFKTYIGKLGELTAIDILCFDDYIKALKNRHDYFHLHGCTVSDNGVEQLYAVDFSLSDLELIFQNVLQGVNPDKDSIAKFKSAMLTFIAEWNFEKKWVQQFHIGPIRNNNTRMFKLLGADTGWDSMGNSVDLQSIAIFLDRLDQQNKLTKTILYSINPNDNDALATMVGNFNDGSYPGKIQLGAAWWFNDQMDGMIQHLKSVGNMGLLSRFIGMLTDSRSFLSFPRHEYFRRILCNFLGTEIAKGRLPNDDKWVGQMVQDICYLNAKKYFNL